MRTIKFRGKNTVTGEWEYGYFWKDDICMTANMSTEDTNFWDAVCIFIYRLSAAAMVIAPLVLEFMERR